MSARRRAREERSAGGVVVRRVEGSLHVLLIRDPYHNWGLPKGHVEVGEDDLAAAVREVTEETGLSGLAVGPAVGTIDWYFRQGSKLIHKTCAFFLMGSAEGEPMPALAEGITECAWIPAEQAPERIAYDNARDVVRSALERLEEGLAALGLE